MTRLKAALLDTVSGAMQGLSVQMEPADLEQSADTKVTVADLQLYARVISTFTKT